MNIKEKREISIQNAINEHYAIISLKIDGTIKEANKNFLNLFGYEENEIINKHHKIFCDENYANSNEYKKFWNDLTSGNIKSGAFKRIKKNGETIFVRASYTPLKNEYGEIFEILKFAEDVTQKRLENLNFEGQIKAINKSLNVIEFDLNGFVLDANTNFLKTSGYELEEILGKHHSFFVEDSYKNSKEYKNFWEKLTKGEFDSGEYLRIAKNQRRIWIQASYNPIFDINNNVIKIVKFAQDVTQEKLSALYYSGQLEAINKSQAVIEFDMNGNILKANDNFLTSMGYKEKEILGKNHTIFCDENYANSIEYKLFWEKLNQGKFDNGKYLRIGKNGKKVWIQATYTPILDIEKKPVKVVKFAQDITQFEVIKKDHLTDLYNREKLVIDIAANENINLAVIDIDDFSSINDFYGYAIGDKLIIKFSKILKNLLNDNFILYRVYADKFAILNLNLSQEKFVSVISILNASIKEVSLDLDIKKFHLNTTCGISFEQSDKLLLTAEISNKYAKKTLKNILVYSKDLNIEKEFEENIFWFHKIKEAIKDDRVILHYQPIFNNKTNKIEKYEALVRIKDEDGTIISPYKFLDVAKKSKQYLEITKIVIKKSFEKFQNSEFEFSINLTVEDILDKELNEFLLTKLDEYKIGKRLVIELVESEKITTYEPVYEFIKKVREFGCKVAIDDFGSGYSNFEYLVKIDADYVKIDGSIIRRIIENENSLEIVKSIVVFCKKMNIKTIGEFISDEDLFHKVVELGLDYSQGFYIGKPE